MERASDADIISLSVTQYYKDYDIDPSFTYIWRYLRNAYETEVFQKSVPCDQDIIKHYEMKVSFSSVHPPRLGPLCLLDYSLLFRMGD